MEPRGHTLERIAQVVGGVLHGDGALRIEHLVIDTRKPFDPQTSLFVALKGERHDGHRYLPESIARGTRAFLVSDASAMGDAPDRIGALRYGADDYVVKPYHPGEVVARVQAVLRRSQQSQVPAAETLRWAGLVVDPVALTAVVDSDSASPRRLDLTPTEFSLLVTLMRAPTRPFTRLFLLEHCLPESDALERVVDTHVYNLRRKLEAAGISDVLPAVRSVGYRFRQP